MKHWFQICLFRTLIGGRTWSQISNISRDFSAKPTEKLRAESCVALISLSLALFRYLCLEKLSLGHDRETYKFNAAFGYPHGFPVLPENLDMVITNGSYENGLKIRKLQ
jgi:hypothetical protein